MYLKRLKLINFKNYEQETFEFCKKINCLVGLNASGKTNVMDAIYYLSFTKSYFSNTDARTIKHGEDFYAIHGFYQNEQEMKVSITLRKGEKKNVRLNEKNYTKLTEHIGRIPLVMISPYDRDLINEGSEVRRKYIDSVISQFDKTYLSNLISYNKVVKQRNILLKKFTEKGNVNLVDIEIWNEQLERLGTEIYTKRDEFIKSYIPIFQKYFDQISNGKEKVSILYKSDIHKQSLADLLKESLQEDLRLRYTTKGIHKDDLSFKIDGYAVKRFGSQGQQKSFVIAMKLAQFEYIYKIMKLKPILLMDDIFDKLDGERVKQLIQMVKKDDFGQIFITDTQKERIVNVFLQINVEHVIYEISGGKKYS